MPQKTSFICSGYNCNRRAKFIRYIDGSKMKFCDVHKYCLDHGRAEQVLEMISSLRMTVDDLRSRFRYDICGFTISELNETIRVMHEELILAVPDGYFEIIKPEEACEFPGCKSSAKDGWYCSNHRDMPSRSVVYSVIDFINKSRTVSEVSIKSNIPHDQARLVLLQLVRFGYAEKTKLGITNYFIGR